MWDRHRRHLSLRPPGAGEEAGWEKKQAGRGTVPAGNGVGTTKVRRGESSERSSDDASVPPGPGKGRANEWPSEERIIDQPQTDCQSQIESARGRSARTAGDPEFMAAATAAVASLHLEVEDGDRQPLAPPPTPQTPLPRAAMPVQRTLFLPQQNYRVRHHFFVCVSQEVWQYRAKLLVPSLPLPYYVLPRYPISHLPKNANAYFHSIWLFLSFA